MVFFNVSEIIKLNISKHQEFKGVFTEALDSKEKINLDGLRNWIGFQTSGDYWDSVLSDKEIFDAIFRFVVKGRRFAIMANHPDFKNPKIIIPLPLNNYNLDLFFMPLPMLRHRPRVATPVTKNLGRLTDGRTVKTGGVGLSFSRWLYLSRELPRLDADSTFKVASDLIKITPKVVKGINIAVNKTPRSLIEESEEWQRLTSIDNPKQRLDYLYKIGALDRIDKIHLWLLHSLNASQIKEINNRYSYLLKNFKPLSLPEDW